MKIAMKKISCLLMISLSLLSVLSACSNSEAAKNSPLKGNIIQHKGTWLFLDQIKGNMVETLDSVKIAENGDFAFNKEIKDKDFYRIRVSENNAVFVVLEPGKSIEYINKNMLLQENYTLDGSDEGKLVLEIKTIRLSINAHRDSLMKVINQAAPEQRGSLQVQLEQSFNDFVGKKLELTRTIIRNNLNTLAAITGAELLDPDQDFVIYNQLAEGLKKNYPNSGYAQSFVARVEQMRAMAIGSEAPEINLPSPDGKLIPLSSLRGKLVLIDFWASWCGPCRMENPNVVRLYNEKKNQGFEVYSVSLDKDKTAWMKAIEKDGLIWPSHVSDLAYWSSVVVKQYGFQGIPFTVLVGKDGKILAKGLRGQQLEEAVAEYLSK